MGKVYVWTEKYSVSVKQLDDHHKKLFSLIDTLHTALAKRQGRDIISHVLDELYEYTCYHFSEEEKLMKKAHCSGMHAHENAHRGFEKQLDEYKKKSDAGMAAFITIEVMKTLNDWLVNHIGRMDKLYVESMNAAGIN